MWLPNAAFAETYRIATFAARLSRDGPGLLLRDLIKGEDPQIAAVTAIITNTSPDILVLAEFDYDYDNRAIAHFAKMLGYPYYFAARPNSGLSHGFDVDGDGRTGEPEDAQGFGWFAGDGGMAILSQFPIDHGNITDLSDVLWRDVPGAVWPDTFSDELLAHQRLSSAAHWIILIKPPNVAPFSIMAYAATPPVFDGPEDRNGLRNRDELRLWELTLDGTYGPVPNSFIIAGNTNLDPVDGEGNNEAMAVFLNDQRIIDPLPGLDTADWPEIDGPGNLRVSYVLPSADWQVTDAGVFWPESDAKDAALLDYSGPHRLVWVDIRR